MKPVFFYISLCLMLLLAACAAPAAAVNPTAAPAESEPEAAGESSACLGSAEEAVVDLDCREVTIAVENVYLPFNYISIETGEPGGWDYDAWEEICTRLHCEPVFVEVAWDGMIQSVADGQYDVAADGITITELRSEIVDFSDGYLQIQQRLLARAGEDRFSGIEDFVADESLVLATQSSTTNYETAMEYLPEERIMAFEQMPFAIQALLSGDADAVMIDAIVGMGYMGTNADQLAFVGDPITSEALGFAFPKGSDLVDPVNQALADMRADGTLEKLNSYYFGPDFDISEEDIVTGE